MKKKSNVLVMTLSTVTILSVALTGCGSQKTQTTQPQPAKYPSGPVTVLVPFKAGSGVDVAARTLSKVLKTELGQPFLVKNVTAGSGAEAIQTMMNQPANGQTLMIHTSTFSFKIASGQLPYTLKDFTPVAMLSGEPIAFFVKADSPYKTLEDLVKSAKAKPGSINIGGTGVESIMQEAAIKFEKATGTNLNYVPYKGGKATVTAVLSGDVAVGVSAPSNALSEVQAGKMRYLGLMSATEMSSYPNVKTFKEQGIDLSMNVWRGLFMRSGTPKSEVAIINKAIVKAMQSSTWKTYAKDENQLNLYMNSADFTNYLTKNIADSAQFIKQVSAKP